MPTSWVYVLRLEDSTLYVGSTGVLLKRMNEHVLHYGSNATRRSKPTDIVALYPCQSRADAYTLELYLQHSQKRTRNLLRSADDLHKLHYEAYLYKQLNQARNDAYREALLAARLRSRLIGKHGRMKQFLERMKNVVVKS